MSKYMLEKLKNELCEVRERTCKERCKYYKEVSAEWETVSEHDAFEKYCANCPLAEIFWEA